MALPPRPTLRQRLRAWLRHWLLGPELVAEITAAAQRLHQLGAETDAQTAARHSAASTAAAIWAAVPGGRLELVLDKLSGCGFSIVLDTRPGHQLYTLYTPEGDRMAWGTELPAMKAYGERLARERTEFDAAASWRH
jgi:hypothetical protein